MNNIPNPDNDPELYKEFVKAYQLAAPHREKVQYRLNLVLSDETYFSISGRFLDDYSFPTNYDPMAYPVTLLDAHTGYIHPSLKV